MKALKRILIIDDDARNIFALTATLKSHGYTSISATDAMTGKKLLEENSDIGIILMDMMMPEMDGYEAIPFLREIKGHLHLPVIAVTAQAMVGDREKCLAAGANDYISKPIDVDRLLKVLEQYLGA